MQKSMKHVVAARHARGRAGEEVVARHGAHERQLHVHVRIDEAGQARD
jgi:hypothetical protein